MGFQCICNTYIPNIGEEARKEEKQYEWTCKINSLCLSRGQVHPYILDYNREHNMHVCILYIFDVQCSLSN